MKLYMMTTQDKYELPLAVAESVHELAEMTGVPPGRITQALSSRKCARKKQTRTPKAACHPKWHKIEIDEV